MKENAGFLLRMVIYCTGRQQCTPRWSRLQLLTSLVEWVHRSKVRGILKVQKRLNKWNIR